ncbi:MAG: glycerophosphodiester phosphodiesterase family protein [Deinococcota bacterium]
MTLFLAPLALAASLWLWYLLWSPRSLAGITSQRPLLLGHRGVRGSQPDNSLPAFQEAFEAGLDGIECDVQMTRDGQLILQHDFELADGRPVRTLTRHEIQQLDGHVISLETLLELAKNYPQTLLNLEIKLPFNTATWRYQWWGSRALEPRLAKLVHEHGLEDRVLVSSFHPLPLARLRMVAPRLRTALLTYKNVSWWIAGLLHVDALHPHHSSIDQTTVAKAHKRALMVNSWTVNDASEVARLMSYATDGLVADDPNALKKAAGRA